MSFVHGDHDDEDDDGAKDSMNINSDGVMGGGQGKGKGVLCRLTSVGEPDAHIYTIKHNRRAKRTKLLHCQNTVICI